MVIKQISYFSYKENDRDSERERILIDSSDIEGLLKKIEDGGNLLDIISKVQGNEGMGRFDRKILGSLKYALFETRGEGEVDGIEVVTRNYQQIGRKLVPHYQTKTRGWVEKMASAPCEYPGKEMHEETLASSDAARFYENWPDYEPFDSAKMLMLNEKQLE